jgi:hypothetical protein
LALSNTLRLRSSSSWLLCEQERCSLRSIRALSKQDHTVRLEHPDARKWHRRDTFSLVAATNDPRKSISLQVAATNEASPLKQEQP